jgi:thioredoxin reductase
LNCISPETSPAFSLLTEHPTGKEYAKYLENIAEFFELNIKTDVEVLNVEKEKEIFHLESSNGIYKSKFIIWAAGEFQYPKEKSFEGANLCIKYSDVSSFFDIKGDEILVIEAYESGFDASIHLVNAGKKVSLVGSEDYLSLANSDSSYSLSPFTRDRLRETKSDILYYGESKVKKIVYKNGKYFLTTVNGNELTSKYKPIDCTGFESSLKIIKHLFEFYENYPLY